MAVVWASPFCRDLHVLYAWGLLIFAPLGILDGWTFSYESFMPSPRSPASKLPQASPEYTTPPTFIWPT